MSYVQQTWETGDIITAEKLNHIESGIGGESGGGSSYKVNPTLGQEDPQTHKVIITLDKTYAEILAMAQTGYVFMLLTSENTPDAFGIEEGVIQYEPLYSLQYSDSVYSVNFSQYGSFTCSAEDEYPYMEFTYGG